MTSVRVCYQTHEFGELDIHMRTLRDKQEYSDPLGEAEALGISSAQWSLFGVVWESSKVLAREMVHFDIQGKRMLEVGCGMALSSLVLNARHADITATDYHPEAGGFLAENVRLNNGARIPFLRTGWDNLNDGLGCFDVIIGSDLLYEVEHIELLSEFISRHCNAPCEVIIVDPGRGKHAQFSKKMVTLGYTHSQRNIENTASSANQLKKIQVLTYTRGQLGL